MPWPGGEAEHRIRATRKKMKRATRKVRTQCAVAYGKPSFLMGKSSFSMGKSSFLMGKSSFLMDKPSFLMDKSSFLMKTMENHHVIAGKINYVNMAMSKFAKCLFTRGYSL